MSRRRRTACEPVSCRGALTGCSHVPGSRGLRIREVGPTKALGLQLPDLCPWFSCGTGGSCPGPGRSGDRTESFQESVVLCSCVRWRGRSSTGWQEGWVWAGGLNLLVLWGITGPRPTRRGPVHGVGRPHECSPTVGPQAGPVPVPGYWAQGRAMCGAGPQPPVEGLPQRVSQEAPGCPGEWHRRCRLSPQPRSWAGHGGAPS